MHDSPPTRESDLSLAQLAADLQVYDGNWREDREVADAPLAAKFFVGPVTALCLLTLIVQQVNPAQREIPPLQILGGWAAFVAVILVILALGTRDKAKVRFVNRVLNLSAQEYDEVAELLPNSIRAEQVGKGTKKSDEWWPRFLEYHLGPEGREAMLQDRAQTDWLLRQAQLSWPIWLVGVGAAIPIPFGVVPLVRIIDHPLTKYAVLAMFLAPLFLSLIAHQGLRTARIRGFESGLRTLTQEQRALVLKLPFLRVYAARALQNLIRQAVVPAAEAPPHLLALRWVDEEITTPKKELVPPE